MKPTSTWLAIAAACLSAPLSAQTFVSNVADIPNGSPGNSSSTENVDFADVDSDGDWDAVFADGGDGGSDQNRIWINMGGLQAGTLGVFVDQTATRFPAAPDQSRDIEFVDFDRDGDHDLYISNTSTISPQTNRWWVNMGGVQGGTIGFYQDQTSLRWVGLGGAGSSIGPGEILGSGGFRDFSCDCDFGDLDNDGDLDLVHSSYGGIFGGQLPTRLFLNNGNGLFSEFNPSGFQLAGQLIQNGNPGIWCEGTQQANTVNATGAQCDIASTALDIDVGDIDGDLDLDILHGAREELPRMFRNRLAETGALAFRDVTGAVFPPGYSIGSGHYEQEMADLDGDGDLDIYGLNWGALDDYTLSNNGGGTYGGQTTLTGSGDDDNEGDFVDHDQDGDVDLFVTSFFASNRLYRNNNNGGAGFSLTLLGGALSPANPGVGLDGDGCDVDGDGDTDVFCANDGGTANTYYENTSNVADTHAPVIFSLEQAPNRSASGAPTVVRAQVYDNAPYYITWYNPTQLEVSVNGGAPSIVKMHSSAGQVFRAEIPGHLVGLICYRVVSADKDGNVGMSGQLCYTASPSATAFCDASDGSLASCPCGNPGDPDSGCDNAQGTGGVTVGIVAQTTSPNGATLSGTGFSTAGLPTSIVIRSAALDPASPVVFGDGLRCIDAAGLVRLAATPASGGSVTHAFGHGAGPGTFFYQLWYRNTPTAFCTPAGFNLSNGERIVW